MAYHDGERPFAVSRLALRDGHRAVRAAVIRALHRDDVLAARDGARHLDGRLDGLAARVPEEERVERGVWHHREQLLDEAEVRLVERDATLHNAKRDQRRGAQRERVGLTCPWTRFIH